MTGTSSVKRKQLFTWQEGKCAKCERVCTLENPTKKRRLFTIDHVVPRRLGGTNAWGNLIGLCVGCNLNKGGQMPSVTLLHYVAKREIRRLQVSAPKGEG